MGPATQSGEHMHRTKYRLPGESFRDAMNRIAATIAPDNFKEFRETLLRMAFMPAGRVQAAIGAPKKVTAYNCFPGEERFLTREGMMTFRSAYDRGTPVDVLCPGIGWVTTAVESFGVQKVVDIIITYGFRMEPEQQTSR
jgi:hypothetical protein